MFSPSRHLCVPLLSKWILAIYPIFKQSLAYVAQKCNADSAVWPTATLLHPFEQLSAKLYVELRSSYSLGMVFCGNGRCSSYLQESD